MIDEANFHFQLPCFAIASQWQTRPDGSLVVDDGLRLVTVELDARDHLAVFTDCDLAEDYCEKVPHDGKWGPMGVFTTPALRRILAAVPESCSRVAFDKNPAVSAGRSVPIAALLGILDRGPEPPIRD